MSAHHLTQIPVGLNVLVADDVSSTRKLMNWILRELNCAIIEEAHNGDDAIAAFEVLAPAVTFLDIDMPGMDGLEVLRRLKVLNPEAFIVIASGCSSLENVKTAFDGGASGFIVKPFSVSKVGDILRKYAQANPDWASGSAPVAKSVLF